MAGIKTNLRARCPKCGTRDVYVRWSSERGASRGRMTFKNHRYCGGKLVCSGPRDGTDALDAMLADSGLWVSYEAYDAGSDPVRDTWRLF
ncbi:hypothetical protein GS506_12830 [Rhodococcus hoagii]|nr:hypothetical protein [Prescottella equi]